MHVPTAPPTAPRNPASAPDARIDAGRHPPTVGRVLSMCLASFGVMIPWPLAGGLLVHGSLDRWDEASLLFGGITGIPLALLSLTGFTEPVFVSLIALVWIAAAIAPNLWLAGRAPTWRSFGAMWALQAAFSLAQAAFGALVILGKNA